MNRLNETKRMGIASIFGCILTAAVILVIPLLLVPESTRSAYFWLRIIWVEILAAIAWGVFGGLLRILFLSKTSLKELNGILPALGMILMSYVGISFLLTIASSYTSETFIPGSYFLIAQILALFMALIICIFLYHASSAASIHLDAVDSNITTPKELCLLLQIQEDRLSKVLGLSESADELGNIRNEIKLLKEKFKYSINLAGSFSGNHEYTLLADNIRNLCTDLSNLDLSKKGKSAELILLEQRAAGLRSKANQVAYE